MDLQPVILIIEIVFLAVVFLCRIYCLDIRRLLCRMYCLDVGQPVKYPANYAGNYHPATNLSRILIITVNDLEIQAVRTAFETAAEQKPRAFTTGDRTYEDLGIVNDSQVFMAISEMGSQGLGASHQTTQKAIAALRPHAVFAVGIAFGINEHKQKLGDILVSRQLMLYELQRVGQKEIVLSWLISFLKPEQLVKARIILRGDRPHGSSALISFLSVTKQSWRKDVGVHFGLVLSGEKLVDNLDYRDSLKKLEPEAIGGEMEGTGVYVSCQDAKVNWIVVKAICDWADGNKGQDKIQRQSLAAKNAADFIVHALQQATLPRTDILSDIVPVANKTK